MTTKQILNSMIFAQAFIESMDEMQISKAYKHRIKQTGNAFIVEVDKYLNAVYGGGVENSILDLQDDVMKTVNEVLEEKVIYK